MLTLPTAAQTHLQGDVISIAFCIEVRKLNGSYLRLTSHNEDITVGGDVYYADAGADATTIKLVNNMAVGGGDIYTTIKSDRINETDIFSGQYNGAAYSIFMINFVAPDDWSVTLSTGILGEVKINGGEFSAELRSIAQRLNRVIGKYYQPGCRAQLFDSECSVNPAAFSYSGTVSAVTSNEAFTGSPTKAANFFKYGRVLWLTGVNAGLVSEIKSSGSAGQVTLFIATGSPIAIGDTYTIREGCDKQFSTCKTKFSNGINFRGEPHIPGIEKAFIARL
jgi:uncharacterized phage protein (TIGR02218 family)